LSPCLFSMLRIAGIIGKGPERQEEQVRQMAACMRHEGSSRLNSYCDAEMGIWLGWIDQAEGGSSDLSPVWNDERTICLLFAGEEFDLGGRGRALVAEYERKGIQFLSELNGWFNGVLIDLREKKVVLFTDRYGLGRLYIHEQPELFFFSSEAKSLLCILPGLREIDFQSLGEFVSCGCPLQNKTVFKGISLLPGASVWTFWAGGKRTKEAFFQKETWEQQPALDAEAYYQALKSTFPRILRKYFAGEAKIGLSLTGGLDGRMIMAWANRAAGTLPCYTFASIYRDSADVRSARRVAKVASQPYSTIPLDAKFLRQFPELAEQAVYISDGAMDITGAAELYLNRLARAIAPVRLTGNYGSEILRGTVAFRPSKVSGGVYDNEFEALCFRGEETYRKEAEGNVLSFIAFKQVPWHHYCRLSIEQSELSVRSPYLDNELVALSYRMPHAMADKSLFLRLIADGNPALSVIPTDRGLRSREVPVLTRLHQIYEAAVLKAEYAYDYAMPHWAAPIDRLLAPFKPARLFLGRHKFQSYRLWYRDDLASYVQEVLLDSRALQRPYLCSKSVKAMVDHHVRGTRNYTRELNKILSLELMQRSLLERRWEGAHNN